LVPVEFPDDETVEALVVRAAVVSQEPKRLLFADDEAQDTVGAVVNARGIATERNVVGELVDFVAKTDAAFLLRTLLQLFASELALFDRAAPAHLNVHWWGYGRGEATGSTGKIDHSGPELGAPVAMQQSLNAACAAQRRACLAHRAAGV